MDQEKVTATFIKDTKNWHRFDLGEGQDVTGVIYVSRDMEVPDEITIALKTKVLQSTTSSGVKKSV